MFPSLSKEKLGKSKELILQNNKNLDKNIENMVHVPCLSNYLSKYVSFFPLLRQNVEQEGHDGPGVASCSGPGELKNPIKGRKKLQNEKKKIY